MKRRETFDMKTSRIRFWLFAAVFLGLFMLESPIILLANRIEPMIFGVPFLVAWVFIWWAFCTVVLYVAYKLNWGLGRKHQEES